ncbi:MAG: hypothetical protein K9J74_02605 [Sulfuritalea sp.]|nr:hypothetical protein [Sulfuritalea sp.]
MALCSDAAMVLYYDITGDNADHDDWHTYEHLHERLSIPGFLRATRWVAVTGAPKYLVIYEVADTEVATSLAYLARLNDPTPWTASMMSRFRGMVRGFCTVVASAGYGLGNAAASVRFMPVVGQESTLQEWLAHGVMPAMATRPGMASVQLLRPVPPPPMTREQSLRGSDTPMSWLLLATAYDTDTLSTVCVEFLDPTSLVQHGAAPEMTQATYALHYTVSAQEVARTAPNPPRQPG